MVPEAGAELGDRPWAKAIRKPEGQGAGPR